MALVLHTGYLPGCIGRIVQLHSGFYSKETGFGLPFEAKVASELSEFMMRYDAATDLLALAVVDGSIEASLAIDGADAGAKGAHLRWFIASDAVKGQGMGSALLKMALEHVDSRRFSKTCLWTFEDLAAARHLYLKFGFRLAHEARGTQWGKEVNEQMYVRGHA
jgi:GNAT superfamily N-acetyltransferase